MTTALRESFDAITDGELHVEIERGTVTLLTHEERTVQMDLSSTDNGPDDLPGHLHITRNQDHGQITFQAKLVPETRYALDRMKDSWNLACQVLLPRDYSVEATTSGGGIDIGYVAGDLVASTSGGSIQAGTVTGRIEAHTSGGEISVDSADGDVEAVTSGGGISVRFASTPRIGGRLETSGGSVSVQMPGDSSLNLDARTNGGTVVCDLPVSGRIDDHVIKGTIGKGGQELFIRTSGGNIEIGPHTIQGGNCE